MTGLLWPLCCTRRAALVRVCRAANSLLLPTAVGHSLSASPVRLLLSMTARVTVPHRFAPPCRPPSCCSLTWCASVSRRVQPAASPPAGAAWRPTTARHRRPRPPTARAPWCRGRASRRCVPAPAPATAPALNAVACAATATLCGATVPGASAWPSLHEPAPRTMPCSTAASTRAAPPLVLVAATALCSPTRPLCPSSLLDRRPATPSPCYLRMKGRRRGAHQAAPVFLSPTAPTRRRQQHRCHRLLLCHRPCHRPSTLAPNQRTPAAAVRARLPSASWTPRLPTTAPTLAPASQRTLASATARQASGACLRLDPGRPTCKLARHEGSCVLAAMLAMEAQTSREFKRLLPMHMQTSQSSCSEQAALGCAWWVALLWRCCGRCTCCN